MTLFEANEIYKSFGGIQALDGASLSVEETELVGIIGPNGAGKTTFFNCLTGFLPIEDGSVTFMGEDVTDLKPHELAIKGMARTFQLTRELETMTVKENMLLPSLNHPGERIIPGILRPESVVQHESEIESKAEELIDRVELDHLENEYSAKLSGGQRKLLEFARVLMLEPELLLLDEPFAGVNPTLTQKLTADIRTANQEDKVTILIIEHEISTLAELVDRLVVLHDGKVLADDSPNEVLQKETVQDAYLGG